MVVPSGLTELETEPCGQPEPEREKEVIWIWGVWRRSLAGADWVREGRRRRRMEGRDLIVGVGFVSVVYSRERKRRLYVGVVISMVAMEGRGDIGDIRRKASGSYISHRHELGQHRGSSER